MARLLQRMTRKTGSRNSGRTSAVRSPELRRTEPGAQVQHLQRTVGNRATARWLRSQLIQPTLTVSRPGDKYEREADRVADDVMRMPDLQEPASIQRAPSTIQRVCKECDEEGQRQSVPDEEEEGVLQAKSAGASEPPGATPGLESYLATSRGAGEPLPMSARAYFEPRFGHDFGGVRVHTDSRTASAAAAIDARAFTTGADVYFGPGRFHPGTPAGDRLLAHELTHVVQQGAARGPAADTAQRQTGVEEPPTTTCDVTVTGQGHLTGTDLTFDISEHQLSEDQQKREVKAFADKWTADGGSDDVQVEGFASTDGPTALNWPLSCRRAEAVRDELVARGVPRDRITTVAHGETDEFSASDLAKNRRVIMARVPGATPPPPPAVCPAVPTTTPADCIDRNAGYCSAAACFAGDPWLKCVCNTSLQICQAVDAFTFKSVQGMQAEACIDATVKSPTNIGAKIETNFKGKWFLDTNKCIWGHWRAALDALHDPTRTVPASLTAPWTAAVAMCRSKGVGSAECCKAQVDAEQQAIDTCGPYDSRRFGSLPTDIPFSSFCSFAARRVAPPPAFTGDFAKVADRIAHGLKLCCP